MPPQPAWNPPPRRPAPALEPEIEDYVEEVLDDGAREPERDESEEGLETYPEYIEEPPFDEEEEPEDALPVEEPAQSPAEELTEEGAEQEAEELEPEPEGDELSLEESDENIWGEGEPAEELEEPREATEAPDEAEATAPCACAEPGEEPSAPESAAEGLGFLGEKTAELFEYLKGLSDDLPDDKRAEFESSGLREKLDGLIGELSRQSSEESPEPGPEAAARGEGLLKAASGRPFDPRRAPLGRRSGGDRRRQDRRVGVERRAVGERRRGEERRGVEERRTPPPVLDIPESLPSEVAAVTVSPNGLPTEIAGFPVSPKLAHLIEIMRREKGNSSE